MLALLDSDSLLYVLGYNFRERMDDPSADIDIQRAADDFVRTILTIVQADSYVGVFSPEKNFRYEVYKYAKYKGERGPKPDWFVRFAPAIKDRLYNKWGFFTVPDLEADDVICALAEYYGPQWKDGVLNVAENKVIICSPDKDLRQIPGLHYDYKQTGAVPFRVTPEEASYNFWYQMIAGDGTDCVAGVPGLGEVKAKALLKGCDEPLHYGTLVMGQYVKCFGNHYGPMIYQETKDTLQLMSSKHRLWYQFFSPDSMIGYHISAIANHVKPFTYNSLVEESPFEELQNSNASSIFGV